VNTQVPYWKLEPGTLREYLGDEKSFAAKTLCHDVFLAFSGLAKAMIAKALGI